jgi:hypothetical protein
MIWLSVCAAAGLPVVTKHDVFYASERRAEFADLDPRMPDDANQFEPFLSPRVLVRRRRRPHWGQPYVRATAS